MFLFLDISTGELMVVALLVLIFFGADKIPEIARGLGKGLNEVKRASNAVKHEIQTEVNKIEHDLNKVKSDIKILPDDLDKPL